METNMGFDMAFGGVPSAAEAFGSIVMDGDEYVRCTRCGYGGCDVRVSVCGCTMHARCIPLEKKGPLSLCPQCDKVTQGLVLFPMSFREIDEAHGAPTGLAPAPKNRGRKRKPTDPMEEKGTYISERRTGRWTVEETTYCDKLMAKFETGELPVADGTKLNEFLGNMLKSKQSRLTKKMKNAKLSTKSFQRSSDSLDLMEARELSELEDLFFQATTDPQERAEIKFHMQKEWRENFSRVCVTIGQPLDADAWLSSVEEMDRRASQAKDAARMAKRKLMMGVALHQDSLNPDQGVFIERTAAESRVAASGYDFANDREMEEEMLSMLAEDKSLIPSLDLNGKSSLLHSAPFLAKVTAYLQRHGVPFEHVDLWVPSFVSGPGGDEHGSVCRLCYAGSSTAEKLVCDDGKKTRDLTSEEQFNLFAFGDYSQKFSFDVGCGLPGRVYESGRPTWEQSVHNAPHHHFERCGGAMQWNIKTVLGIPIASPNVGRIVVVLYSGLDRPKEEDLVDRLSEEFTRLMPSPKWKLVVDIGDVEDATMMPVGNAVNHSTGVGRSTVASLQDPHDYDPADIVLASSVACVPSHGEFPLSSGHGVPIPVSDGSRDHRMDDLVSLLGEFMPSDPNSSLAPYLPGFMSLRLLLLRPPRTNEEKDMVKTMLESFSSYTSGGRDRSDIAVMLARDYMYLSQQQLQQPPFLNLGQNVLMNANAASAPLGEGAQQNGSSLSLFGLPSTSSSLQNSPALTPIPIRGINDSMSIVSN